MRQLEILWVLMETPATNAPFRYLVGELGKRHAASLCTFLPAEGAAELRRGAHLYQGDGTIRGFISAAGRALRSTDVDVVSIHLPHLAILTVPLLVRHLGWRWRRWSVYVVHNSFPSLRFRNKILTVAALTLFRHVVVCGAAAASSLPAPVRRLAGTGMRIIPNGADIRGVEEITGSSPEAATGGFTVLTAARLEPVKKLEDAVRAFAAASLHEGHMVLVGDGSQRPALEDLAESVAPGKVLFTGMVPREDVYAAMGDADCYLSTSSTEGMPVAVLEAMAAGLLLVLSDIPPHREIADGHAGVRFVPIGDVPGFASALGELASLGGAERARHGAQLKEHVAANFSLDAYLDAYEDLYLSLAKT